MWFVFLVLAIVWVLIVVVHISLELNKIDKGVASVGERLQEHYENN